MIRSTRWSAAAALATLASCSVSYPSVDHPMPDFEAHCRREVPELHAFFQDWFNGALPATDAAFARFADVMATDFEIVAPSGKRTERRALLEGLRAAHGAHREHPIRIWVENVRVRSIEDGLAIVSYEEWQEEAGEKRGRLSTAVHRQRPDAPNQVEWLHVHETWLPK